MHVQSCCFLCLNLLLYCCSRCRRRRRCVNPLVIRAVRPCRPMAHARTKMAFFFTASKKPSEFLVCLRPPFLSKSVQFLSHPARLQTTTLLLQFRRDEKRLLRGLTPSCLGFACSNFAKKNKRLLAENGISCVLIKNIYMSQICYSYD